MWSVVRVVVMLVLSREEGGIPASTTSLESLSTARDLDTLHQDKHNLG